MAALDGYQASHESELRPGYLEGGKLEVARKSVAMIMELNVRSPLLHVHMVIRLFAAGSAF